MDAGNKSVSALTRYGEKQFRDEFLKMLLGGHVARLHDTGVISREEANQWWC
jgi:hypothetical protein